MATSPPPLPSGYTLDEPPPLPQGYTLDAAAPSATAPQQPSAAQRFGGGLWATTIGGLKDTGIAALDLVRQAAMGRLTPDPDSAGGRAIIGLVQSHIDQAQKAKEALQKGDYSEAFGHTLATILPGIGPAAAHAGEQIGEGNVAGGLGEAAGLIGSVVAGPKAVKAVGTKVLKPAAVAAAPAIDAAMEATAQRLRQASLRGGYTVNTPNAEVVGAAKAMRGLPLTPEALDQVTATERALQQQKMQILAEAEQQGAAVPRSKILDDLQTLRSKYENQGLPAQDLKQIDKAIAEVQNTYPESIPVTKAEAIKEGTPYREGVPPNMQATVASEQQIKSTVQQYLADTVPEVDEINKTQQGQIWLKKFMGNAINKRLNSSGFLKRVFNVPVLGAGGAASFVGGPAVGTGAALTAAVLSDPVIQSHLAVMINKAQQLNPARWGTPNMGTAFARAAGIAGAAGADEAATPGASPAATGEGLFATMTPAEAEAAFQEQKARIQAAAAAAAAAKKRAE